MSIQCYKPYKCAHEQKEKWLPGVSSQHLYCYGIISCDMRNEDRCGFPDGVSKCYGVLVFAVRVTINKIAMETFLNIS